LTFLFNGLFVCRKADLRELKRLQMEENRLLQALDTKAKAALDELARKQESDMQVRVTMEGFTFWPR